MAHPGGNTDGGTAIIIKTSNKQQEPNYYTEVNIYIHSSDISSNSDENY